LSPLIAILLISGTTGLVAYLTMRRAKPRITTIETHTDTEHKGD
jgi:hypothetical protein